MEKIIKKLFVAGSLLVGAAVSFMSLTTYAVTETGSTAMSGAAANTTFSLTVDNVITLSEVTIGGVNSDGKIAASPTAIVDSGTINATVTTNSKFTISLSATKPQLTLNNATATADNTKQIPAVVPSAGANGWGVKKSGTSSYTVLTTSPVAFYTKSTVGAFSDTVTLGIGISVAPSLPAGDYKTAITVTAATQA